MQGMASLQSVVTYPVGAGLGQRIIIDGPRGAIFEYDNANNLVASWAASAGVDDFGNPYPQGFNITIGTISGSFFVINSSGIFIYSAAPALGNLVISITSLGGTDPFGNVYKAGFNNYGSTFSLQASNGAVFFTDNNFSVNAARVGISTSGIGGQTVALGSGNTQIGVPIGSLAISDGSVPGGTPVANFNGLFQALLAQIITTSPSGNLLVVQNNSSGPSGSAIQVHVAAALDNALGIDVAADAFNRIRFNTAGFRIGPGNVTQDARFERSSPGVFLSDTIVDNNGGVAETWHSLGTLTGATVNIARYRMMPDGVVHIEIDVVWGVATAAATLTFSNTLPVAYRPLAADVDVRRPMSMTNGAGVIARLFIGQSGGGSPGQVQIANLGAGNYIGTYSAEANYGVI